MKHQEEYETVVEYEDIINSQEEDLNSFLFFKSCIKENKRHSEEKLETCLNSCLKKTKKKYNKQKCKIKIKENNCLIFNKKVPADKTFGDIMTETTNEKGVLFFNGYKIYSTTTPKMLGIKKGDIIEFRKDKDRQEKNEYKRKKASFTIRLRTKEINHKKTFDAETEIRKILSFFNEKYQKECKKVLFDGESLDLNQTIEKIEIEDGDVLDLK